MFFFFLFFNLDTMGMCRMYPIKFFPFFLPHQSFFSFVILVFLSLSKELRDGPNQNQSYLTISLLYFYLLEFYFNVRRYFEEKSGYLMNKNELLSGWPFSFICLLLIVIHFSREDHRSCCTATATKTFQSIILNNYVQTSSPRLSLEEEEFTL